VGTIAEFLVDFLVEIFIKLFGRFENKHLSENKSKIGFMNADDIELYHNFSIIEKNILDIQENTLYLASPHLKYWFENSYDTRMERLLRNTKYFNVSVIYFNYEDIENTIVSGMEVAKRKFPERFKYVIRRRHADLSYIIYIQGEKRRYRRSIIGYQNTIYSKTPFLEFFDGYGAENDFIISLLNNHKWEVENEKV
jgi:hypothetical protein